LPSIFENDIEERVFFSESCSIQWRQAKTDARKKSTIQHDQVSHQFSLHIYVSYPELDSVVRFGSVLPLYIQAQHHVVDEEKSSAITISTTTAATTTTTATTTAT
jgi:hypothetical protein